MPSKRINHPVNTFLVAVLALLAGCGDFYTNEDGIMSEALLDEIRPHVGGDAAALREIAAFADAEDMGIEVHVEGMSLLLDFSNVHDSGVVDAFYVLAVDDEKSPAIVDVVLDEALSSVDSGSLELRFNDRQIVVDLRGLACDDSTFIKIDVLLDDAA